MRRPPRDGPLLGVSIVNYFSVEATRHLLNDLIPLSLLMDLRVVVIDNSALQSPDDADTLKSVCEQAAFDCTYLPNQNAGFAGGHNAALRQLSTGPRGPGAVWFLNPDIRLRPEGLESLRAHLERFSAEPWIFATNVDASGGSSRAGTSRIDLLTTRTRHSSPSEHTSDRYGPLFAEGYSFFITAPALRVLEGLSESFFLFYEEADLAARAGALDVPLGIVPDLRVIHDKGGSTGSAMPRRERSPTTLFHANRSCVVLFRKHYRRRLVLCLGARLGQAVQLLCRGQFTRSHAVLSGLRAGLTARL